MNAIAKTTAAAAPKADPRQTLSGDALQTYMFTTFQPATRAAVLRLHAMNSEMYGLDKPLPILNWLRFWLEDEDLPELSEADIPAVLMAATKPGVACQFTNATGIKNWIAAKLAKIVKDRREQARKLRQYEQRQARESEPRQQWGPGEGPLASLAKSFAVPPPERTGEQSRRELERIIAAESQQGG